MPNPSRKIPKQQEKRRHWVDDKGWTHITKGTRPTGQKVNETKYTGSRRGPAKVPDGMTLQNVVDKYQVFRGRFRRSTCWIELEKFLEETILKVDSLEIKSCVCTGFGSFTAHPKPNCPTLEEASLYQLAAFESMLEILRKINSYHPD